MAPSIGGELGGPKSTKYQRGGFGLHFFEQGRSRLVNASHISFCMILVNLRQN